MWKKLNLFSRNKQTNKQTKTPHKKLYITVNKNDFNRSLMFCLKNIEIKRHIW